MTVTEPRQTRFDLHGRLLGVPIRIHPLFWLASALLGLRFYADPQAGSLAWFTWWMFVVLVSLLLHELGHVLAARLFGMRGGIVLGCLGGLTTGIESLPRAWQRVVVLLAGPLVQVVIVAAVWGIASAPFPTVFFQWGWQTAVPTGVAIVAWVNLYWALFNLLPLWPLDGGRVVCAAAEGLLGRRGRTLALVLCLVACGLLAVLLMVEASWRLQVLRYDPRFVLDLEQSAVLVLFCFLLWLHTFRALWPEEPSPAA